MDKKQIAEMMNVSVRSMERAKRIASRAPELEPALMAGLITLGMAERLIKHIPKDDYLKIIATGNKQTIRQLAKKALAFPLMCSIPRFSHRQMTIECNRLANKYGDRPEFLDYWREHLEMEEG